jgi:hypothetical protein
VRKLLFLPVLLVVAGCGASKGAQTVVTTTTPPPVSSPLSALRGSHVLYYSGRWAVLQKGARAVAAHRIGRRWQLVRRSTVRIEILGPRPGSKAPTLPQIAAQLTSQSALVESGLWVDGKELVVKGGGSPTLATIYGAPAHDLRRGRHVAVAYGRSDRSGTARAWVFRTP